MSEPTPSLVPSATDYYPPVPVSAPPEPKQIYWLHALLLLVTCFTTVVVGARMEFNFLRDQPIFSLGDGSFSSFFPVVWAFSNPANLWLGVPFASTLMLILLAHEMGHYLYCKRYAVWATLPFFIPAPTLIGTLGAFIRIRSPIRSRTALFDIGIAGPIAGFVVALAVLSVSLGLSKPIPPGTPAADLELGFPLIFQLMQHLLMAAGHARAVTSMPLDGVILHPTTIAAWVGMFATSLNLLPGGQLDGGHIVFSLAPRAHSTVSRLTILILLPMAYYLWVGWFV
jgi:Zn-dependent protease